VTAAAVAVLWRYSVKSMAGESLTELDVVSGGVVGDRAYARCAMNVDVNRSI